MAKTVYLAPGHGRRPDGRVDPGASGGGTNEQEAGDQAARAVERILLDNWQSVEVSRQPKGGPNFEGTRTEIDNLGPDVALELHHDWIRAPRGGFGFHPGSGPKRDICRALEQAYKARGLRTRPHLEHLPGTSSQPGLYRASTQPTVLWEIDRIGEYTEDHAWAIAEGLASFLGLPAIPAADPADPDPSAPDRGYVTVGDSGGKVREWQQLLVDRGFALPRYGADGIFGEETRRATLQAYGAVGLAASDPTRPRVGVRSFDALRSYRAQPWRGRQVRARVDLRFYPEPRWDLPAGVIRAGQRFAGGIHDKRRVGGGEQYQVSNSRGERFWITANPRFIRLVG